MTSMGACTYFGDSSSEKLCRIDHSLGLNHCEVLADAGPWPTGEGQERVGVLGCPCHSILKPFGPELAGVVAPDLLVAVDRRYRDLQDRALRHPDASYLEVGARLPLQQRDRGVHPQRLEEEHVDQFEPVEHVAAGGDLVAALPPHFLAELLLPLRVRAEQEGGPGEQVRGGVVPSEEGLALVDDLVHAQDRAVPVLRRAGFQHQPEQVVVAIAVGILVDEAALDDVHEAFR
jgi:hypothetical protein